MPDPTDKQYSAEPPATRGADPSRRRLLQGGLAAAPVLMTLVSRPVLAQQCTTPSGYVSANASTAGRGVACTGRTLGYWKNSQNFSSWPPPYQTTTLFNSVFNNPPYGPFAGKTLLDVLQLTGGAPINDVARLIVAALLNAAAGLTPVLTVQAVKDIWGEYSTTLSFSPFAGASWNHDELVDYLLTTTPS
jgi:hypothetical protein